MSSNTDKWSFIFAGIGISFMLCTFIVTSKKESVQKPASPSSQPQQVRHPTLVPAWSRIVSASPRADVIVDYEVQLTLLPDGSRMYTRRSVNSTEFDFTVIVPPTTPSNREVEP